MRPALFLLILGLFVGCGAAKVDSRVLIPLTQLPKSVRIAAYNSVAGIRFHAAWQTNDGKYQLRGKDPAGNSIDVFLSPDGTVLSIN